MDDMLGDLKHRTVATIDELRGRLTELALEIHAHPELGFQEHRSAARLVETLQAGGFNPTIGVGGLETAFRAQHGTGAGPTIAILAEYDALPGIGHGCGHNLICTAAVGAGLALRAAVPELAGTLLVLGTPAEEGGGGKVIMARAGAFDGVDAAMMFHPATRTMVNRGSKAMVRVKVEFHGKAAHASSAPDMGINALEAMIQTFVMVNGLRQHLRKDAVFHGIITDGGKAANIIPDYTAAQFSIRASNYRYRDEIVDRLRGIVEAASLATGCRGAVTPGMSYDNIVPNLAIGEAFERNLELSGVPYARAGDDERMGSTDMGDVSHLMPVIHPYLAIASEAVGGHTVEMASAAASERGIEAAIAAAKGLALTCLDLFFQPNLLHRAKAEFREHLAAGRVRGVVAPPLAGS